MATTTEKTKKPLDINKGLAKIKALDAKEKAKASAPKKKAITTEGKKKRRESYTLSAEALAKRKACSPEKCPQYTTLGASTANAKTAFNIIRNSPKEFQTVDGKRKKVYKDRDFAGQVPKVYAAIRGIQASRKVGKEPTASDVNALSGFIATYKSKYYKA